MFHLCPVFLHMDGNPFKSLVFFILYKFTQNYLYSILFGKHSLKDKQMSDFIVDVLRNYFMNYFKILNLYMSISYPFNI